MLHYYIIKLLVIIKAGFYCSMHTTDSQTHFYHHTNRKLSRMAENSATVCSQLDIKIDSQNHGKLFASICFLPKLKYFKIHFSFIIVCGSQLAFLKSGHNLTSYLYINYYNRQYIVVLSLKNIASQLSQLLSMSMQTIVD